MNSFEQHNPTKLIFGKGTLSNLSKEVAQYGKKILLVYGGGSIKRTGIYENVLNELKKINAEVHELAGVEPNPRLSTVEKGIAICKENDIDFLLAVGGGSVIDATKAIAVGAKFDGNVWDIITKKAVAEDALPLGTVLTLAATGSEMNSGSVITNWETHEKYGWGTPHVFPKFSILDPTHTFSVPKDQTIYGIVDIMSHTLELYFHHVENTPLKDRFCESLLQTMIETGPKLLEDLESFDHRETVMICGTVALNQTLLLGALGDWATHNIEHSVSAVYDIPHAGGLAIIFPNWMEHVIDENVPRFKQLATRVFGINPEGKTDKEVALAGIDALRTFWSSLGAPKTLADYNIDDEKLDVMVEKAMANGPFGRFKVLESDDVKQILTKSL
ncbi:NADH-dependent alcohol dehydrogenase [Lottiidibacillus patelloidae]|uniref:NADH-dependent alcohol dehydrogenase n=1 Tax=Lottiidibacillus patelloidae TaxID=2670334 RepID=A0A263BR47_9BACI|nr:iron-containing alcohol dehydrogenase [Lottiidibacillus patelloidae]OZM56183.1 NADH-dependent alcohol dehydrogenase [Lottiidibacillus patelloidae]